MIPHVGNGAAICFCALPRLPSYWKVSNNPKTTTTTTTTTTLEDWHEVVWIAKKIEQAIKMEKIEGSTKDSRTMMRDESKEDSDGVKP